MPLDMNARILIIAMFGASLAGCATGGNGGGASAPAIPNDASVAMDAARAVPAVSSSPGVAAYKVLYAFAGGTDGAHPEASLIVSGGALYGTTIEGGKNNDGTVFAITTAGVESVVHTFTGQPDGALPVAPLVDGGGTLYGTTQSGGLANVNSPVGNGTVFSIDLNRNEKVVYSFTGGADGGSPAAGLIAVGGLFYGTTSSGGAGGNGTVFRVDSSGVERVLHGFAGGSDGADPVAPLLGYGGSRYGTTVSGGTAGKGTIFKLSSAGVESIVDSFAGGTADGAAPASGLVELNGIFYGTTTEGGAHNKGTVFSLDPSIGVETVLHSFSGFPSDGADPAGGLIAVNGVLYGTTRSGGGSNDGTVFSLTTSGTETILHSFRGGNDGSQPDAGLVNDDGTFYGTTAEGGAAGYGTVFKIRP